MVEKVWGDGLMNYPAASRRGITTECFIIRIKIRGTEFTSFANAEPRAALALAVAQLNAKAFGEANKTREIPRLRSGSLPALPFRQARVRLNNFSSLSFLKL